MEELINKLYDKICKEKDFGPEEELLFNELKFVLKSMEEAKANVETEGLMVNITRDEKKEAFFRKNNYIALYDNYFDKMMRLLKAFHLTPEQKTKVKEEKEKSKNRILDLSRT